MKWKSKKVDFKEKSLVWICVSLEEGISLNDDFVGLFLHKDISEKYTHI